jgi:type IV secretory pathway VirB4 component
VIVWDKNKDSLVENAATVEAAILDMGIPVVVEDFKLKDVWYGTIPGMVMPNMRSPMVEVQDMSELILL